MKYCFEVCLHLEALKNTITTMATLFLRNCSIFMEKSLTFYYGLKRNVAIKPKEVTSDTHQVAGTKVLLIYSSKTDYLTIWKHIEEKAQIFLKSSILLFFTCFFFSNPMTHSDKNVAINLIIVLRGLIILLFG